MAIHGHRQWPRRLLADLLAARHTAGQMQTRRRPNHRNKLKSDQPREERSSHSIRQCARRKERKQLTAEVTALDAKAAKVWHFALTLINRALSSYIFLLTVKHESNNCHLSDSLALLPMLSTLRELATMTSSFMSPKISEIWILGAIINLPYGCRVTTNADLCANYFNTAHERERLFSDNLSPFFCASIARISIAHLHME